MGDNYTYIKPISEIEIFGMKRLRIKLREDFFGGFNQ